MASSGVSIVAVSGVVVPVRPVAAGNLTEEATDPGATRPTQTAAVEREIEPSLTVRADMWSLRWATHTGPVKFASNGGFLLRFSFGGV